MYVIEVEATDERRVLWSRLAGVYANPPGPAERDLQKNRFAQEARGNFSPDQWERLVWHAHTRAVEPIDPTRV